MEHVELNNDVETPIAGSGTNTFAKKRLQKKHPNHRRRALEGGCFSYLLMFFLLKFQDFASQIHRSSCGPHPSIPFPSNDAAIRSPL